MLESISLSILILIAGLGLGGATSAECSQALQSAGYSFTDQQIDVIADYANDPSVIYYVNTNSSDLIDAYNSGVVSPGADAQTTITKMDQLTEEHPYLAAGIVTIDGLNPAIGLSDMLGLNQEVTIDVIPVQGSITKVNDGQGGCIYLTYDQDPTHYLTSEHIPSSEVYLWHSDANGNVTFINGNSVGTGAWYSFDIDVSVSPDDPNVCLVHVTGLYEGQDIWDLQYRSVDIGAPADPKPDGEPLTMGITDSGDLVLPDGTVVKKNEDGVFVLPDGTVITQNPDGTYGVGDYTYTPSAVIPDTSIDDLLSGILDKINDISTTLTIDKTKDKDDLLDDAAEAAEEAAAGYEGDLGEFKLGSGIASVFPFCIPFDFVRGVQLFSAQPVPPKFSIPFDIPAIGAYPGTRQTIDLDFSKYDKYFVIVRWGTTMIFLLNLCFISTKIVKGAGA